jgi:alkylhydroperoxidase/carboxymuconolactone decarboxylase family protein YurZ
MNPNTRVLIGLGASVAANCAPCFDQYYAKALELKITMEDIRAAVGIGGQMKTGGNLAMINRVKEIMDGKNQDGIGVCDPAGLDPDSPKPSCCG